MAANQDPQDSGAGSLGSTEGPTTGRRLRVCVVDDEAEVRRLFATLIGRWEEMEFCGSYGEAQEALAGMVAAKPDVILLDVLMPDMSGIECA